MDEKTRVLIKKILWDYHIPVEDVHLVIRGKKALCGHWNFEDIFIRLLERISWYELLYVFGLNKIKKELTVERIAKIYNPELRRRYERLQHILHGEPVSFTKWGPEFSKKIGNSLFSNRWYST